MVLVTGKAGYIGSVVPGLGLDIKKTHYVADIRHPHLVKQALKDVDVVVHLAAFKSVDESVSDPMKYWDNNFVGTLRLCEAMQDAGVERIVFASSAAVYGSTPYGQSKLACEQLLKSLPLKAAILRLFNVDGGSLMKAKESGLVRVYGKDYPTRDGTCERDYISLKDVSKAISLSVEYLRDGGKTFSADIGTGEPLSVLKAIGSTPYVISKRRVGDMAVSVADTNRAKEVLGFTASERVF